MSKKNYEPTEYEKKLRESIIEEFGRVCPYIKVKEKDVNVAKENGMTDEEITKQFLATCINQLYNEIFKNDEKS